MWLFPEFDEDQAYNSPDLGEVVQEVVDRPDWQAGNYLGVVVDGSPSAASNNWRCFYNFAGPSPPRLMVEYYVSGAGGPIGPTMGSRGYGRETRTGSFSAFRLCDVTAESAGP